MGTPLLRTPLYDAHREAGARLVPFAGWEMPVQYAGVLKEHAAVRESAGLFDVSHMGELRFRGEGAAALLDGLVTNDVAALPVGHALYALACNAEGGVLDDLIVYRLAETDFLIVCNAANREKMAGHFAMHAQGRCEFEDQSDDTALLALQGPRAVDVMEALGASRALLDLPRFGVAWGQLAGIDLLVARTGYTGEDGFELFCKASEARGLWKAVLSCPAPEVAPVGLGARDTLRLEAALRLYGNEMDEQTTPFEAGLAWTVKLDRADFMGRDALVEKKAAGPTRKLVGLEMVGRGIARHGYAVLDGEGQRIGEITSGSPAPSLGKNIALAFVPPGLAHPGATFFVEIRGKAIEARTTSLPFYKRG